MAKKPSSSSHPPFLHAFHHHKEWNLAMRNTGSFLLWVLLVSSTFILFIISSPKVPVPPPSNPKQALPLEISLPQQHAGGDEVECDLFSGEWVREVGGSAAYSNRTCPTMPESKDCKKYGKAMDFLNWRWKPKMCELPRFDPKEFFDIVRGKTMAFIGDSVARNQADSLLCLLSLVEKPVDLYKDDEDRYHTWHFNSSNFTLMVMFTKFLVQGIERTINGTETGTYDLHLDKIDMKWAEKLQEINYIIISSGHWFFRKNYFHEGGKLIGCSCSEANATEISIVSAIRRAFKAALQFISKCKECETLTLVRTFSPAHFEGGSWNGGGYCNRTRPLMMKDVSLGGTDWEIRNAQVEAMERMREEVQRGRRRFGVLDVAKAMVVRADGHPGLHWNNQWMKGYSDCVHWCLPGAIDMWNDALLQVMKRDLRLPDNVSS